MPIRENRYLYSDSGKMGVMKSKLIYNLMPQIVEYCSCGILLINFDEKILYSNQAARSFDIFATSEITGKKLEQVFRGHCPISEHIAELREKRECHFKYHRKFKNNRDKYYLFDNRVICNPQTDERLIYISIREITEAEEAIRSKDRHLDFLDNLFKALSFPMVIVNAENFIIEMTNETARKQGIYEGMKCFGYHGGSGHCDCEPAECPITLVRKSRNAVRLEHCHHDSMGKEATIEIHAYPLLNSEGEVTRVIKTMFDITRVKKIEEYSNSVKEQLITEQVALRKKHTVLKEILNNIEEEKNIVKSNFVSNIDINIRPIVQSLRDIGDPRFQKHLDMLEKSLNEISSPFLGKLENTCQDLAPREIEISNMIKRGLPSKAIASTLNISVETANWYRKSIRKKLGLVNRAVNLKTYLNEM